MNDIVFMLLRGLFAVTLTGLAPFTLGRIAAYAGSHKGVPLLDLPQKLWLTPRKMAKAWWAFALVGILLAIVGHTLGNPASSNVLWFLMPLAVLWWAICFAFGIGWGRRTHDPRSGRLQ